MSAKRQSAKAKKTVAPPVVSLLWLKPVVLVIALFSLLLWAGEQLKDPSVMPVNTVGVDGEMRFIKRARLEKVVAEAVNGSFFSVDLKRMCERIERMPWVKSASVRRVWPDTLRVQVTEQSPMAYWGEDALVSQFGEVFKPETLPHLEGLAKLIGEPQHAKTITREYQRMDTLLETAGLKLTHVWVDARQAWSIKADNGLMLQLGRRDVMQRLTRFVRLYPDLMAQQEQQLKEVDLRYTNGFSVKWESDEEQEQAAQGYQQNIGFHRYGALSNSTEPHHLLSKTGESHG
jgi:cell division protein FtsQ